MSLISYKMHFYQSKYGMNGLNSENPESVEAANLMKEKVSQYA